MKRLLSVILMLVLAASLFACKRADDGEGAADASVPDASVPDREITADKDAPAQDEGTADDTPASAAKPDAPDDGNTALSPRFIASMPFSPYEVVVTLTAEESAKGKTYTPADFPQTDVFNVFEYDCFSAEEYPDYAGKTTLFLMLNEPDKATVLNYVDVLKEDPRVYNANVNVIEFTAGYVAVTLTKEQAEKQTYYTKNDFPDAKLRFIYANEKIIRGNHGTDHYPDTVAGTETAEQRTMFPATGLNDNEKSELIKLLKYFAKDERIESCMPVYKYKPSGSLKIKVYTPTGKTADGIFSEEIKKEFSISKVELVSREGSTRTGNSGKTYDCCEYTVLFSDPADMMNVERCAKALQTAAEAEEFIFERTRENGKYYMDWIPD